MICKFWSVKSHAITFKVVDLLCKRVKSCDTYSIFLKVFLLIRLFGLALFFKMVSVSIAPR
jgi:hypothetical protein